MVSESSAVVPQHDGGRPEEGGVRVRGDSARVLVQPWAGGGAEGAGTLRVTSLSLRGAGDPAT